MTTGTASEVLERRSPGQHGMPVTFGGAPSTSVRRHVMIAFPVSHRLLGGPESTTGRRGHVPEHGSGGSAALLNKRSVADVRRQAQYNPQMRYRGVTLALACPAVPPRTWADRSPYWRHTAPPVRCGPA